MKFLRTKKTYTPTVKFNNGKYMRRNVRSRKYEKSCMDMDMDIESELFNMLPDC